jgi:hypothetical protein
VAIREDVMRELSKAACPQGLPRRPKRAPRNDKGVNNRKNTRKYPPVFRSVASPNSSGCESVGISLSLFL